MSSSGPCLQHSMFSFGQCGDSVCWMVVHACCPGSIDASRVGVFPVMESINCLILIYCVGVGQSGPTFPVTPTKKGQISCWHRWKTKQKLTSCKTKYCSKLRAGLTVWGIKDGIIWVAITCIDKPYFLSLRSFR